MTKTKQLIERNLTFDKKYVYLSITRGNILDGTCCNCDNCGKLITNMVLVAEKETGKKYTIGTDCAETLSTAKCLYNNGTATDFYVDIAAFNETARFVTELNAGAIYSGDSFMLFVDNRKGKQITCFRHNLVKFFPEYVTD